MEVHSNPSNNPSLSLRRSSVGKSDGGWNVNIVATSIHCWQNSVDIPTVLQRRCDNGIRF